MSDKNLDDLTNAAKLKLQAQKKQEEPQPNTVVNQNIYINNTSNFNI